MHTSCATMVIRCVLFQIENVWEDAEDSLAAGIIAGNSMITNTGAVVCEDVEVATEDINNMDEIARSFEGFEKIADKPIYRVKKKNWVCLFGHNLICKKLATLTGVGDNISCAGFIYHQTK